MTTDNASSSPQPGSGGAGSAIAAKLQAICAGAERRFKDNKRILSFAEYLELVDQHPQRHARTSAQYLRDCFDHFGATTIERAGVQRRRFNLFDCPWDQGRERLVGQEDAQEAVYRILTNFVQEGRIQRLILLHGPNGSAKSSLIRCMMRALEAYSHTDEGALYTFNWVFPTEKISRGSIGFGGGKGDSDAADAQRLDTYAYLDDLNIDAKIASDLRDHPLLVLPQEARQDLVHAALQARAGDADRASFIVSDLLQRGDLSHMSKQIFEALLTAYQGDLGAVLRHVQVERFFISRRYRVGAITIEPQLRVDAGVRQITADRSLQALPASLQTQTLFEPFGDLVDANRGLVEYNDVLKRQSEFNKYLLATSEKGTATLDNSILFLDTVLVGSANETYLDAFKTTPDYPSFKARFELVRMPYLLDFHVEQQIYDEQISSTEIGKPILPHTTTVAALWAVLTRLKPPVTETVDDEALSDAIGALSPLQKALLYADGVTPDGLDADVARDLKRYLPDLLDQGTETTRYEGRHGASPREMKMLLLNAAQNPKYPHLSPLAIFDELRVLIKDRSVYTFLQMEAKGDYYKHGDFIDHINDWYLDILDREVRAAMGLVDEARYEEFFNRYVVHATHWVRNEQVYNTTTGLYEDPDAVLMQEVESRLGIAGNPRDFRGDLMTAIAAWSLDHPGEKVVYKQIFPQHVEALQEAYFQERQGQIKRIKENLIAFLDDDAGGLSSAELAQVTQTLDTLQTRFGYTRDGAREVIVFLLQRRYAE